LNPRLTPVWSLLTWLAFISGEGPEAHELLATARVDDGTIHLTATYDDGTSAAGVSYRLLDAQGRPLAEGHADAGGEARLRLDRLLDWEMTVEDAMGHAARLRLSPLERLDERTNGLQRGADGPAGAEGRTYRSSPRPARWGAVVAGLGYVAGLTGLGFYWLSRRERGRLDAP